MCIDKKQSGFTNCGCSSVVESQKSKVKGQNPQPSTSKTEKDLKDEAEKYSNDEVPNYNKLFIGTLFGVGLLLFNARGD